MFEAVVNWTNHDLAARMECVPQLMENVRLPLLAEEYLVQRVEEEPLVKNSSLCKDFLIEAMKFHLLKGDQKLMYKTPRTKPRTPIGLPKVGVVNVVWSWIAGLLIYFFYYICAEFCFWISNVNINTNPNFEIVFYIIACFGFTGFHLYAELFTPLPIGLA